jgi:hypothetical protein
VSQDTAPARPVRRTTQVVLAALALPAVLALAACDGTNASAPAAAVAVGPASDSTSTHEAVCAKAEAAWAAFVPKAYGVDVGRTSTGVKTYIRINYRAYDLVSIGLFDSLTGNRDFKLAYDVDSLATDASAVYGDPGQRISPKKDLAALKKDASVLAKECGTTLKVPAS